MTGRIKEVHPVLMSRDIEASIAFYERLGFRALFRDREDDPRYAGLRRDDAEIHLQWQDSSHWQHPGDRPTYRFLVAGVDALYADWVESSAIPVPPVMATPWASPADTPWGTHEFHVRDPDGNGLQFYQRSSR